MGFIQKNNNSRAAFTIIEVMVALGIASLGLFAITEMMNLSAKNMRNVTATSEWARLEALAQMVFNDNQSCVNTLGANVVAGAAPASFNLTTLKDKGNNVTATVGQSFGSGLTLNSVVVVPVYVSPNNYTAQVTLKATKDVNLGGNTKSYGPINLNLHTSTTTDLTSSCSSTSLFSSGPQYSIQYNKNGGFAGSSNLTWDEATSKVSLTGSMSINGGNQSSLQFLNANGTSGMLIGRSLYNNNANDFFIYDAAASTNRLLIDSTGVHVVSLTMNGGNQSSLQFLNANGTSGMLIGRSLYNNNANDFFIYDVAASTNRVLVNSTGMQVAGDINGTRLCISSDCKSAWPTSAATTISGGTSCATGQVMTGISTSGTQVTPICSAVVCKAILAQCTNSAAGAKDTACTVSCPTGFVLRSGGGMCGWTGVNSTVRDSCAGDINGCDAWVAPAPVGNSWRLYCNALAGHDNMYVQAVCCDH